MRVLVTGGAGFIGSNLCGALLDAGNEVAVLDDLSAGHRENVDGRSEFHHLDILDEALESAIAGFAPEAVVHLAAQASVTASVADPARDWALNAEGTAAVAAAALAAGSRRLISASSAAVYGQPALVPLLESSPRSPVNPYGRSKLAAEGLLADALADSGVDFASFRFSNVYGPRQDAQGEGGVVAIFSHALASGGTPTIFGTGRQTRDFIFVGDVVDAIIAGLESPVSLSSAVPAASAVESAAFNVSTGHETSVREIAEMIADVSGVSPVFAHRSRAEGDVDRSALDPSKLASVIGWHAATSLREGLERTWSWFCSE
jgi:UDP-glucose 4-epimerase